MSTRPVVPPAGAILRRAITMAFLWALAVGAGGRLAHAADSNPPERLTYQGFLANPDGTPFAPTTPINYDIVFRIYDAQTGGTPVWAEKQTVTVDKGQFAVLLGEGAANGSELRPSLSTVFAGATASDRYMELTVTINNAPLTIAPRLRLLTSAYAFLARNATALVSPNGSSVASAANGALTVNGSLNAGALTATSLAGNAAGLTGLTAGQIPALDASKIGSGTFTPAQIPSLDAGKITSGTLSATQIPSLDASKITSGILPIDKGGTGSSSPNFVDLTTEQTYIRGNKSFYNYVAINGGSTTVPRKALDVYGTAIIRDFLGIGTATPRVALHVAGNWNYSGNEQDRAGHAIGQHVDTSYGVYLSNNGSSLSEDAANARDGDNWTIGYGSLSALFEGGIVVKQRVWVGQNLSYSSDIRAKLVLGNSNSGRDLDTLLKLKVTDYRWIDRSKDQHKNHKRLIAQEVEAVFPQAVSIAPQSETIPSVYEMATGVEHDAASGTLRITTKKEHGFKVGDKVDIYTDETPYNAIGVKAVASPNQFTVACDKPAKKVFVYGKQVKDFRTVDYDAISMLNVSATQELARQVQALRKSEARVAELEQKVSRMEALERRAARVEALEWKATKVETLERDLAELKKLVTRLAGPRLDERPAAEALPTTSTAAPKQ